jgi:U3 small nucleolar RNA-associated protein 10
MSTLAHQLAQSASLNSSLLADRSRRKATESYLLTGRDADAHDLESIHALGLNGLLQLAKLDPNLKHYEILLFGESIKGLDRTLLNKVELFELNSDIERFIQQLGPWVMEAPTGLIIEWLVRKLR